MLRPRAPRPDEGETRGAFDCDLQTLEQRGAALLARQQGALVSGTRIAYARAIRSHARRLQRRLRAIEGDLDRAGDVDALRSNASLLLSHLHALDPRAQEATLLDYTLDPPTEVQLKFDVGLGPRRQADLWFHRARRHERGAAMARQRLALTRGELDATVRLLEQVESADDEQVLERLVPELEREGIPVPVATDRKRSATPAARLPYREYTGTGGRAILVGRGPEDNDRLTLDHARPQDLWLHARGYAGAHVIVPLERDEACPPDLLCDAATLAAHYSKAKGQARVDVAYTPRRYVRKPRKAAPGLVTLQREKVFRLELEPARLERLMVSERRRSQAQ